MNNFKYRGYIYITINQQENKCYVGQKSKSPENSKDYLGSGSLFQRKLKKYGKQFFKKIILGEIFSNDLEDFKKQLNICETECIYFFRAYGSDGKNKDEIYGYNLLPEGGSKLGSKDTEEVKEKKSIANFKRYEDPKEREKTGQKSHQRFIDNPDMHKIYSEAAKKKNKECPEIVMQRTKTRMETNKKEGQREKLSQAQIDSYQKNPQRKINLSNSIIKSYKENPQTRENLCEGQQKRFLDPNEHLKVSIMMTNLYKDPLEREKQRQAQLKSYKENPERKLNQQKAFQKRRELLNDPILQYNKKGEFIKEYKNYQVAQYELKIQHILEVLNGERKSCSGFIWKYKYPR